MKSEAKRIYYKRGGKKFRDFSITLIILYGIPILFVVLDWIGCWDIGVNFSFVSILVILISLVLTFLLSVATFSVFIPRTKFKEIEYEGNKIAVFTNKKSLDKGILTLYINGIETTKEYDRFANYRWGHYRGIALLLIIFDVIFYSKAKKEEIKRKEDVVKISQTIDNCRITAKYNRFTKKIEININNKDFY